MITSLELLFMKLVLYCGFGFLYPNCGTTSSTYVIVLELPLVLGIDVLDVTVTSVYFSGAKLLIYFFLCPHDPPTPAHAFDYYGKLWFLLVKSLLFLLLLLLFVIGTIIVNPWDARVLILISWCISIINVLAGVWPLFFFLFYLVL